MKQFSNSLCSEIENVIFLSTKICKKQLIAKLFLIISLFNQNFKFFKVFYKFLNWS